MKVSACIIAKDEQVMLPGCLESIHKWVDEIIIVDTGSTDRTNAIAKQYGAKIYSHPWQNDFSLHRNQSIEYATGEWIMIIDCDERVVSDMSKFKDRLKKIPPEVTALVVTLTEMQDGSPSTSWLGIRFFRKSSGIHYKNVIHNKAVYEGGCAATDIQMHHLGYSLSPEQMEKKRERTEALLIERLGNNPDDVIVYYYLCQMKIGQKDYDLAERYGLEFFERVQLSPKDLQYTSVMYFYMAWVYLHKNDGEKAYAWANKGIELFSDDLDLNYMMARLGYQAKRDDLLAKHSAVYFNLLPEVRNRGQRDTDRFENVITPNDWYNRTTYTANDLAERDMKKFVGALYAHT